MRVVPSKTGMPGIKEGALDFMIFLLILTGVVGAGRLHVHSQYALPAEVQSCTLEWAMVGEQIGRAVDVPREVPLVLWYLEGGMRQENPPDCAGIVGLYDQVRSGNLPCFEPGLIDAAEVTEQLWLGAAEFKLGCPEVTYHTADPAVLKRCYLVYDAGVHAADVLDPDRSAFVMNGYDEAHQGMIYQDIELEMVDSRNLGAWPTHLAMQSLIIGNWDESVIRRPLFWFDKLVLDWRDRLAAWDATRDRGLGDGEWREPRVDDCLVKPHPRGKLGLKPNRQPVVGDVLVTQDLHGCHFGLPGLDLSSPDGIVLLQAPMSGDLVTYPDQWGNFTIRIENEEWVVWLLHPRSSLITEGEVKAGDLVGVIGSVDSLIEPKIHYTIYDKVAGGFVDPGHFIPPVAEPH